MRMDRTIVLLLGAAGAAAGAAAPARANTVQTTVEADLDGAGGYALLASAGLTINFGQAGTQNDGSGDVIFGNVGAASVLILGSGDVVHGEADYGTSIQNAGSVLGGAVQKSTPYWTGIQSDLATASSYLNGLAAGSQVSVHTQAQLAAGTLTSAGAGFTNVYDVGFLNLSGTLTLSGDASSVFVINVSGASNSLNGVKIALSGGLTANDVYFNFINASGSLFVQPSGVNTLIGTFLAPTGDWQFGNLGTDSNVLGTSASGFRLLTEEINIGSSYASTDPRFAPVNGLTTSGAPPVPEPTSIALLGVGAVALGVRRGARARS